MEKLCILFCMLSCVIGESFHFFVDNFWGSLLNWTIYWLFLKLSTGSMLEISDICLILGGAVGI